MSAEKPSFWSTLPGILTATATLVAAIGGLIGGLAAAGLIGGSHAHSGSPGLPPQPTTVRIENANGGHQRGFFAQDGTIITTNDPYNALGRPPLQAVWTQGGKEHKAAVERVPDSTKGWVTLLRLVGTDGPKVEWSVGSAADLSQGARVTELGLAAGGVRGHVRKTGVDIQFQGTTARNLLVVSRVSGFGDGGSPILDSRGSVVGMVVGEDAKSTYAIPIETIRDDLPDSF